LIPILTRPSGGTGNGSLLDWFARASRGEVDRASWQSLSKLHDESGGPYITGWILAPFPYMKDERTGRATVRNRWLTEESPRSEVDDLGEEEDGEPDGPTDEQFPGGLSRAPFRWHYPVRTFDMEFLGGFVGVAQDPETLALRPEIGWAVREAEARA
jgi:Domain of unknown function (DUF4419)